MSIEFLIVEIMSARVHTQSLQLYLSLCDPMDCSPQAPLSIGKNTGVDYHAFLQGSS